MTTLLFAIPLLLFISICIDYTLCATPLIQDLPDSSFTASSYYPNPACYPVQAKFTRDDSYTWCCGESASDCIDDQDYLTIDLTEIKEIESISTKGRYSGTTGLCNQKVISYNLKYSIDGNSYISYNSNPLYSNNNDSDCNEIINVLDNRIQARYLRFYPLTYGGTGNSNTGYPSMKVEAYEYIGCDESTTEFHVSFLLDESGSIEEENGEGSWDTMIDFVKDVIERDINDDSYINVITFSNRNDINTIYSFSDQYSQSLDRTQIYNALDNIVYNGGATYTYDGIQAAINEFESAGFTENNVLFVITDGEYSPESNDPCDLSSTLSSNNIALIEIAVNTDYSMDCADYKFVVDSFSEDDFEVIVDEIKDITCVDCDLYEAVCTSSPSSASSSSSITYNNYNYDNFPAEFYHSQWIGFIAGFITFPALIGLVLICNYLLTINKRRYGYDKVVIDDDDNK